MHAPTPTRPAANLIDYDAELLHRIQTALAASGHPQLRVLRIGVHEGYVTLRGCVTSYYQKQLAQEVAKRVDGAEALRNEIVVD